MSKVIFRKWRHGNRNIIALFPTIPADNHGRFCTAFEHVGQHGAADHGTVIRATRPATARECKALVAELRQRGYGLQVVKRATPAMHAERRRAALSKAEGV